MTDRVHSLTVVLKKDVRVDDVAGLCNAIMHFEGVVDVRENVADLTSHMAEQRALDKLREKIYAALREER